MVDVVAVGIRFAVPQGHTHARRSARPAQEVPWRGQLENELGKWALPPTRTLKPQNSKEWGSGSWRGFSSPPLTFFSWGDGDFRGVAKDRRILLVQRYAGARYGMRATEPS